MDINYHAHQTPQFRVLSDRQIEALYRATLECLYRTGVNVLCAEARDLLRDAGAEVDGARVRIPPHIIQDAVASSPRCFNIWGRDAKTTIQVAADRVYFGPGPTCTYFIDADTLERRKVVRGDPAMVARVCDGLDNIDYVMSLGLIDDVHPTLSPVFEFAEMLMNTGKPVLGWAYSLENMEDLYKIAVAVAGGEDAFRRRPLLAYFATFQSPLQHTDEELCNALWAVERGIPLIYIGGGTAGMTSPITGAGTLVVTLAASLSGLAIFQLKRRGTPVCIGGVPQVMDLRTARPSYGSPEMSLFGAAFSDICRYLHVPFMGTAGASEAKVVDLQAAIESTMQVVLSALSGATLVHDVGFLDCADIGSLEMLVMNDEIIDMMRRVMCGIEVSDDTIMLDLIDEIGPGGEYITTAETANLCREEIWIPSLFGRDGWEVWEAAGSPRMLDRIRVRVREILAEHEPPPLAEDVRDRVEEILRAAEARVGA
jgi:trimethylamine--corrinoid protein Co-methyltransferase